MQQTENRDNFILLPNSDRHNCFGCSPGNPYGLKMEFYTNVKRDIAVSWLIIQENFCGWSNLVHGGIISTILDEAMGWGALVIMKKLVLSKSIAVDFVKPVFINSEIRVEGSMLEVRSEREAVIQGHIYDKNNEICSQSSSVVSLFTFESVRKMGVVDEKMLNEIEQLMNEWDG